METEKHYFKVGLFCLIVAAVFVSFLVAFRSNHDNDDMLRYVIYFDGSVAGLAEGAPVRLKGIKVGEVSSLRFIANRNDRIAIFVDITENAPLREDTTASIAFLGITGTAYISLENMHPEQPPVYLKRPKHDQFPTIPSRTSALQEVMSSTPELMGSMKELIAQMRKLVSDSNIATAQGVLAEASSTLREFKMLAHTLRDDPSVILRGSKYDGYKVKQQ